jgi:hypothetical protein
MSLEDINKEMSTQLIIEAQCRHDDLIPNPTYRPSSEGPAGAVFGEQTASNVGFHNSHNM